MLREFYSIRGICRGFTSILMSCIPLPICAISRLMSSCLDLANLACIKLCNLAFKADFLKFIARVSQTFNTFPFLDERSYITEILGLLLPFLDELSYISEILGLLRGEICCAAVVAVGIRIYRAGEVSVGSLRCVPVLICVVGAGCRGIASFCYNSWTKRRSPPRPFLNEERTCI